METHWISLDTIMWLKNFRKHHMTVYYVDMCLQLFRSKTVPWMLRYVSSLCITASLYRILSGKRRDVDILPNLVAVPPCAPHPIMVSFICTAPLYKQKPQALQNQNESIDLQFAEIQAVCSMNKSEAWWSLLNCTGNICHLVKTQMLGICFQIFKFSQTLNIGRHLSGVAQGMHQLRSVARFGRSASSNLVIGAST